jgi:pilus assembly protein CpaE
MASLNLVDNLSSTAFSVAVVDGDPKLRTRLARRLGEATRVSAFASLDDALAKTGAGGPVVLVLGTSFEAPAELAVATELARSRPDVAVVLVVTVLSTDVLQQAIRAGVRDVVELPAETDVLLNAVQRAAEPLVNAAAPATPRPLGGGGGHGRVVTVFSTKGGTGKSIVATNLAVVLARQSDRPVALVDADLQFGDVAVMLKMSPQHTIVNVVEAGERLDVGLLQSFLMRHSGSGLLVLPAPVEPAFADAVAMSDLSRILNLLRSFCSHVVVDTPAYFNDIVLGLLEETDDIVLVAGMDIAAIKNVKIGLQTLRLLNIPASKVKLILNRANSKVKLDVADVERTLQMRADCQIPSDIAVPQSINRGTPVVLEAPRSGVARSLERLAALFPAFEQSQQAR